MSAIRCSPVFALQPWAYAAWTPCLLPFSMPGSRYVRSCRLRAAFFPLGKARSRRGGCSAEGLYDPRAACAPIRDSHTTCGDVPLLAGSAFISARSCPRRSLSAPGAVPCLPRVAHAVSTATRYLRHPRAPVWQSSVASWILAARKGAQDEAIAAQEGVRLVGAASRSRAPRPSVRSRDRRCILTTARPSIGQLRRERHLLGSVQPSALLACPARPVA